VGSTALSSAIDAEDLRSIIREYQRACAEVIATYGGFVAQYLGDGVMAYFGYPSAQENDAENAVRAGIAIVQRVTARRIGSVEPKVRVGIASGVAVVGDLVGSGAAAERAVVGQVPNLAARVQSLAEPNGVVIAQATRQLLGAQFELSDLGPQSLKGLAEPENAWCVVRERSTASRFAATRDQNLTSYVGRADERALLGAKLVAALEGRGGVVCIHGDAGIGKSRLVRFVLDSMQDSRGITPWELQCSPYNTQSPLFPTVEALQRRVFPTGRPKDAGAQWNELKRYVERNLPQYEDASVLFAELLTIALPSEQTALALTRERRKQLTHQLFLDLTFAGSQNGASILLIEDIHWADPSTLELLTYLIEQAERRPLMVLLTYRPEFVPAWGHRSHVLDLSLTRLPKSEAMELVQRCSGATPLAADLMRRVVEKTDGVPLYLEEFTRAVIASGVGVGGTSVTPNLGIPATLHDSLQSRLDRLGTAKVTAQLASALGRDFNSELLEKIWSSNPESLEHDLGLLASAGFIEPRDNLNQGNYRFMHALIRDAAYESMLKSTRSELHRRIAETLERESPDRVAAQPELIAQHYTLGRRYETAVPFWLMAGRQALGRNAYTEAVAHLQSGLAALAQLPEGADRVRLELDLQLTLGPALIAAKGYASDDVGPTWMRARELCSVVDDVSRKIVMLFGLWTFHVVRANHAEAIALTEQMDAIAAATQSEEILLAAHLMRGISQFFVGKIDAALESLTQCVQLHDPVRHAAHAYQFGQDPGSVAWAYLSWLHWLKGNRRRALECEARALALARSIHHPFSLSFVLAFASWLRVYTGEPEACSVYLRETLELCTDQEIQVFLAHGLVIDGWSACEASPTQSSIEKLGAGLRQFRATGSRCFLPYWETLQALSYANAGDPMLADRMLASAFDAMQRSGERWSEPELHRVRGLFWANANPERADASFRLAIDVARRQGANVWVVRAGASLAKHWIRTGRQEQARAFLREILAGTGDNPNDHDFDEAQQLLTAPSQFTTTI
jgi:predicted ATPase/class 3 adenylate cyclase